MFPKDVDEKVNSMYPEETGAVWSVSALFQVCLSENLGSLLYYMYSSFWQINRRYTMSF